MFPLRLALPGAFALLLAACAVAPSEDIGLSVASLPSSVAVAPSPLISGFDSMHSSLPGFELASGSEESQGREVSVERNVKFAVDSSIVSDADVQRIAMLQAYLGANPSVGVRIEGYDDGAPRTEITDLAVSRAQAVVRALLTDMRVQNEMSAVAAPMPHLPGRAGHAEVIFIGAHSFDILEAPRLKAGLSGGLQ